jgi:hypothetical protein
MSDSELSDAPTDLDSHNHHDELFLPPLRLQSTPIPSSSQIPTPVYLQPPQTVMLPPSSSKLFTKGLYRRELLDTQPATVRMICLQLDCTYSTLPQALSQSSTGNLWRHYSQKHPDISYRMKSDNQSLSSPSSSASSFFEPRLSTNVKQSNNPVKY